MNFAEAEDYLFSLGNEVEAMKLGLDNIRKLLDALGNPQTKYLKVQVAGTNGKGSVCAFLNSICLEAGIRTGLYTSPHLVSITERVKIDGVDINEDNFAKFATYVRSISESLVERGDIEKVPTYFEQVTAIALLAFADANVELAILETGLGGRFDAVTAANAEIAAITRIDYDHQRQLGESLAEIASEKAAIIHPDSKVVVGEQPNEAMKIINDRCSSFGVVPLMTSEVLVTKGRNTTGRECASFVTKRGAPQKPNVFPPVCLGLHGRHQFENAKIAILLAEILQDSFEISTDIVALGLANTQHPGRLEWVDNFLLDGAHNVGGARALADYLDEVVAAPITLIFAAMKDKNVSEIAHILFPLADNILLSQTKNSRAFSVEQLASFIPDTFDQSKVHHLRNVAEAVEKARTLKEESGVILVTGSLYLVGEVKKILQSDDTI